MKAKTKPATIGQRIRAARLAAGLTQEQLSAKSGVSQPTISALETSDIIQPTVRTLVRLAAGLGCEVGELIG
jgi:transcriptional regulator with XRE-family HTH domain